MPRREETQATDARVAAVVAPDEALLCSVLVGASSFLLRLPVHGEALVGRGPECDVQLVSGGVSRTHARLTIAAGRAELVDLGSRNGTFVNGEKIDGARVVGAGDDVGIGDARFVLLRASGTPARTPAVATHRALVDRLDADLARTERVAVIVLDLAARWYETAPVLALVGALEGGAYAGLLHDHALVVVLPGASRDDAERFAADLGARARKEGVELAAGTAAADAARDLAHAGALLAAAEREAAQRASDAVAAGQPAASSPSMSASGPPSAGGAPSRGPASRRAPQPLVVDAQMRRLHAEAVRVAATGISVLLVGETGVGKELFARAIHEASGRPGKLVGINAAALPEQLLETELFGHERGAFSGAVTAKPGLVELADHGTLFLDEVGELPLSVQAKLLRVLEERAVRRVGGTQERRIDLRVVSATNVDLDAAVEDKRFRRDLLFRLNACTLVVPPLRERPGEILPLAEALVRELGSRARLASDVVSALQHHAWPGNVRELRNTLERAVAMAGGDATSIELEHLPRSLTDAVRARSVTLAPAPPPAGGVRDSVKEFERQKIVDALAKTNGNQTRAAELLGIPRRTLAYKMAKLGITS